MESSGQRRCQSRAWRSTLLRMRAGGPSFLPPAPPTASLVLGSGDALFPPHPTPAPALRMRGRLTAGAPGVRCRPLPAGGVSVMRAEEWGWPEEEEEEVVGSACLNWPVYEACVPSVEVEQRFSSAWANI